MLRFVALEILKSSEAYKIKNPIFSHRVEHGLVSTVVGNIVCESKDQGKSWEEICISDPSDIQGGCSRDPILEMPDQSLLMPIYHGSPQRTETASLIRSYDGGRSWQNTSTIITMIMGKILNNMGKL